MGRTDGLLGQSHHNMREHQLELVGSEEVFRACVLSCSKMESALLQVMSNILPSSPFNLPACLNL